MKIGKLLQQAILKPLKDSILKVDQEFCYPSNYPQHFLPYMGVEQQMLITEIG